MSKENVVPMTAISAATETAFPVVLMHDYEGGKVVKTYAVRRPGASSRNTLFMAGAWQTESGSVFFILEDGRRIDAATPAELVAAVIAARHNTLSRRQA